jgi:hypothetical protein
MPHGCIEEPDRLGGPTWEVKKDAHPPGSGGVPRYPGVVMDVTGTGVSPVTARDMPRTPA